MERQLIQKKILNAKNQFVLENDNLHGTASDLDTNKISVSLPHFNDFEKALTTIQKN